MADPSIYATARELIERGLRDGDSALTPGEPVWSAASADDLYERFVRVPLAGPGSFLDKLSIQLRDAPPLTVQLAAELLLLHLLAPDRDMHGPAKRRVLDVVLGLMPEPPPLPVAMSLALDSGFARVGNYYLTRRDVQLSFLVRLVQHWRTLDAATAEQAVLGPWSFRDQVDEVLIESAWSQRNALLHLAFPNTFQSIVSRDHKSRIVAAFAERIGGATGDQDRDLLAMKAELERESGEPVAWYRSNWEQIWNPHDEPSSDVPVRGWLVRGANVDGQNLIEQWRHEGYCSVGFSEAGEVTPGATRKQIVDQILEAEPDLSPSQAGARAGNVQRFINEIRTGDLVCTVDGQTIYVGRVAGEPTWDASRPELSRRRRAVSWYETANPITRAQLSDAGRDRLQGQNTVSSMKGEAAELASLVEGEGGGAQLPVLVNEDAIELVLPNPPASLARELFVSETWLGETVDLLREKKQLVFYGPPGTGKTWIAQAVARWLAEETGGQTRLVQFHPSYAYEDFFEGFRPRAGAAEGSLTYALEHGPLRMLATQAEANPGGAHVLVVDEINRANLAKVFGELYFLLEYRDRQVSLQYSPAEDFALPENVFLIGTMNTADRSIALVDAAMRRRFAWQGLFPTDEPVAGMLRAWLYDKGLPGDLADLLDLLNSRIDDPDLAIGPSYLMSPSAGTTAGLERIWKHQILPLLHERYMGEGIDVVERFGLAALRVALSASE